MGACMHAIVPGGWQGWWGEGGGFQQLGTVIAKLSECAGLGRTMWCLRNVPCCGSRDMQPSLCCKHALPASSLSPRPAMTPVAAPSSALLPPSLLAAQLYDIIGVALPATSTYFLQNT